MFDPTLPVKTRDGRKARIICTDANRLGRTIVALVGQSDGSDFLMRYHANGLVDISPLNCHYDLINTVEEDNGK